jgi:hypothetical protein
MRADAFLLWPSPRVGLWIGFVLLILFFPVAGFFLRMFEV